MERKIIMLNSITYAYKARDFLYQKGITAYIERVPANLRKNGCGYGIKVSIDNFDKTINLLNFAGYRIRDVIAL